MSGYETLINLIHREAVRVISRMTRRTPAIVDSYDPKTHAAKFKLMPDSSGQPVITGWLPLHTHQTGNNYGWHMPPRINDHGWLEFHEDDREGATWVGGMFNDKFKPLPTQPGELQYQTVWGHVMYFKQDGTITFKNGTKSNADAQGTSKQSTIVLDASGNVSVTANNNVNVTASSSGTITFKAQKIVHDGSVYLGGADASNPASMKGTTDAEGNADISNLATKVFVK
jgi:phage baseplate assembly protein gpV